MFKNCPRITREAFTQVSSDGVLCVREEVGIIGLYCLEDDNGQAVCDSVVADRDVKMLNNFDLPSLHRRHLARQNIWF